MKPIDIQSLSEIETPAWGYVAEPNVESVIQQFLERFGRLPEAIYRRISKAGTTTLYVPVTVEEANNGHG